MQRELNHLIRRKQKRKRFFVILAITVVTSIVAVSMRECSQNFQEPYNKDYKPLDKQQATS
jgi:membrane-anchored protein YejM (alkaline phosphatase superfamily)